MSDEKRKLVIVVTNGFHDERSSVAWSVANSGINSGLEVTMFLVSSGVDWVPIVDTYRTLCIVPSPEVRAAFHAVRKFGA